MKTFIVILLFLGVIRNGIKLVSCGLVLLGRADIGKLETLGFTRKVYWRSIPEHLIAMSAYLVALSYLPF